MSDKERQAQQEALFKDVATIVSEKCVNPETKIPYPVSIIEKAMKECHIAVKANKGAKQQALETVTKLKVQLPIERAQMRLRIAVPLQGNYSYSFTSGQNNHTPVNEMQANYSLVPNRRHVPINRQTKALNVSCSNLKTCLKASESVYYTLLTYTV